MLRPSFFTMVTFIYVYKVLSTTLIAYDKRKIENFNRTLLFNKETSIPFQAIKSVKKDTGGSGKYQSDQVKIDYITYNDDTQEVEVYTGQFFNFFTGQNQQRRYEILSRALTTD